MGFFDVRYERKGKPNLSGFITQDRTLHVPKDYWARIVDEFDRDVLIDEICDLYERHKLPNPLLVDKGLGAALHAFRRLVAYDTRKAFVFSDHDVFARQEYRYSINLKTYLQAPSSFNDASDHFHRRNRMRAGHVNFNAPLEAWNDLRKRKLILKSQFSLKQPYLNSNTIETAFHLRHYAATQFKPAAAKAIYDLFKAKHVWDPSAGWGDRFAGFSAALSTQSYIGTDPNADLHEDYWKQGLCYATGKAYHFLCCGSEVVDLSDYKFDLIFTSPPYFNTEKYSEHPEQSWKRYQSLESWQADFLHKTIERGWQSLRYGGFLVINIADLGSKNETAAVCDPMNDFVSTLPGARYAGAIGMRMSARPQTGIEQDEVGRVIFVEPVWVWSKKSSITVDDCLERHIGTVGSWI